MASLTAKPSYHFSHALTLALAGNPNVFGPVDLNQLLKNPPPSAHADLPEGDRLSGLVNDHLDKLGLDNVALIFEGPPGGSTIAIITCFEWCTTNYLVAVKPDNGGWMMLDGQQITAASNAFMGIAERALSMLANPAVEYIMRQPSSGMSTFSKNRERKGEEAVADMQIVHLTKRIYVGGHTIYPDRDHHTGREHCPHDRRGHYRHSKRAIAGWEGPVVETSGEWAGVTCYRRWIDDVKIKGGTPEQGPGRGHPKAAQPKAPQYRVLK